MVSVPGRTFPVSNYYLEDLLDRTDHVIEEGSRYAHRDAGPNQTTEKLWVTGRGGRQHAENFAVESQVDVSDVSGDFPGYKMATQRYGNRVCAWPSTFAHMVLLMWLLMWLLLWLLLLFSQARLT